VGPGRIWGAGAHWGSGFWIWGAGAWAWYTGAWYVSPAYPGWVWVGPPWEWDGTQWTSQEGYWTTADMPQEAPRMSQPPPEE